MQPLGQIGFKDVIYHQKELRRLVEEAVVLRQTPIQEFLSHVGTITNVPIFVQLMGILMIYLKKKDGAAPKKGFTIKCSEIVRKYNKSMGGVDLCDTFSLYRTNITTRR